MAVSQAAMVAVMTMTPVHMKLHGHETMSPYVISAHIGGMFAFSPLVGRYVDRRGSLSTVQVGAAILVGRRCWPRRRGSPSGCCSPPCGRWTGLELRSARRIGAAHRVGRVRGRVGVQGTADLTMSLCGAVAGFASGFIRRAVGYHVLADIAAAAAVGLLVAAYVSSRRSTPPDRRGAPEPGVTVAGLD